MTASRLSRLQRRILAWLAAEEQRTRGTMAASHQDLVHALAADKGNLSHSLANLEVKGLIQVSRTPGGKAEAVELTPVGRREVVNKEKAPMGPVMLAALLMLALGSPTLADTRCTTRYDAAFRRWVTECSDGARAITKYDEQFQRYRTDIVRPPQADKSPHGWPAPGKAPQR